MIVGVDTATNRWHAVGLRGDPRRFMPSRCLAKTGSIDDKRQRLVEVFDAFLGAATTVSGDEPVHVFTEYPISLGNGETNVKLGLVAGALWAAHLRHDVWWHWINISTWQAWIGVSSKDSSAQRKAQSRAFGIERGMDEDLDEDHYDAGCIALKGAYDLAQMPDAWKP